jgi:2,4-diketo-3-deoxy-L-fuconate hydrolase
MKLIRFGENTFEKPGILLPDGRRIDASAEFSDYDEAFFEAGGLLALSKWVNAGCPRGVLVDSQTRLGPPVSRPSKIVCIGQNYIDHAIELNEGIPIEPAIFLKATSAWSGPFDDVMTPRHSSKLDYEVELALVIGRRASGVDDTDSLDYVAGYSTFCDYSERVFQKEMGGQWTKGKSADSFAPMGPWLLTSDQIEDPQKLHLWSKVNGELRQNSQTGDMLFTVRQLVSYVSQFMTLLPGDVIATGTPSGVAMGMNPPQYLQVGDFVECGVTGLGELGQRVVAHC